MKTILTIAALCCTSAAMAQQRPLTAGQPFVADRTASLGSRAPTVSSRNLTLKNGQAAKPAQSHGQGQTLASTTRADAQAVALSDAQGGQGGNGGGATVKGSRPAAYAPSVNPTANCAMSTGVGIAGQFSLGATHVEPNCARIERAKAIAALGDPATAVEVMCADEDVRAAKRRTNNPCFSDTAAGRQAAQADLMTLAADRARTVSYVNP